MISRLKHCLSFIVCLGISTPTFAVWDIVAWDPPLDYEGQTRSLMYQPIGEASQAWHLCVTYPHLKDPYWLSVNYGMVEEVKRLGVNMRVLEAGGYPQLATQVEQLSHCVDAASDAIIVGTVSFNGLSPSIRTIAKTTPVIAAVNDIANVGISAKAGVSWYSMGAMIMWLFIGSWTFSSVFSYLGGHEIFEHFFKSIEITTWQFLIITQIIIFLLGWPLEWTEILIIFVPIFLPLLEVFDVNPYFFAMLIALNLQTSFLTPPMAMSAYYLKGVQKNNVELMEIFAGIMPFLGIVIFAMFLMYMFPGIALWLPETLFAN